MVALAIGCGDPYVAATPTPTPTTSPPITAVTEASGPTPAQIRERGNHLVGEASPYLLQHAHNPIDWYPWSAETLARAKAEGRPIFVSIGYATCHWCHVMERESFEDDEIAAFLNAHFIAIKVDREQRPDVDALYIGAVAAMGGDTGWPLNVFLTPEGVPIVGGTYFPPRPDGRRPGFLALVQQVHADWTAQGPAVGQRGADILDAMARRGAGPGRDPNAADLDAAMADLARRRDDVRGGYGTRQKFPNVPVLLASLRWSMQGDDEARREARAHVVTTLERMRDGGLRDAVAGSFHRYCVDPDWRIPHFEKTLYDNAQLAVLYLEAARRLARPELLAVARGILDDLVDHWQAPGGGFIVGFDADDAAGEGRFYTWTAPELAAVLDAEGTAAVGAVFGVAEPGDRELEGRSVLRRAIGPDAAIVARAEAALPALAKARDARPAPARDDKILVGWNAMTIEALVQGATDLDEPRYLAAAVATAAFIEARATKAGVLRRGVRGEADLGEAFADDHALLARALLQLHAATGDLAYLRRAHALAQTLHDDFFDAERGGIRRSRGGADTPITTLDMDDHAVPSAGAVTAALWLELGALVGDDRLWDAGHQLVARWSRNAIDNPLSSGMWLATIDAQVVGFHELVIAGAAGAVATQALVDAADARDPARVAVARIDGAGIDASDATRWPALDGKRAQGPGATAYLCNRGSCRAPTGDPAVLRQQLAAIAGVRPPARE